jgi:hypothetical protein
MRVNADFLRDLDPRKSYDRGPLALPGDVRPHGPTGAVADSIGGSRLAEHLPNDSNNWIRSEMSESARDLSSMSLEELRRELKRREEGVARLQERRARIVEELEQLDAEIRRCGGAAVLGGMAGEADSAPHRPRAVTPRPKNTLSLAEALTAAIDAGTVVSPAEAADLVRKSGYLTNSRTFVQSVTVALSKHSGFRRVERGRYECIL